MDFAEYNRRFFIWSMLYAAQISPLLLLFQSICGLCVTRILVFRTRPLWYLSSHLKMSAPWFFRCLSLLRSGHSSFLIQCLTLVSIWKMTAFLHSVYFAIVKDPYLLFDDFSASSNKFVSICILLEKPQFIYLLSITRDRTPLFSFDQRFSLVIVSIKIA